MMNLDLNDMHTWSRVSWNTILDDCGHDWCLSELGFSATPFMLVLDHDVIKTVSRQPLSTIGARDININGMWQFIHYTDRDKVGGMYLFRHENDAIRFKLEVG